MVTRVHRDIPPVTAHGEYTGIAKFTRAGAAALRGHFAAARAQYAGKPFREAALFENLVKRDLAELRPDIILELIELPAFESLRFHSIIGGGELAEYGICVEMGRPHRVGPIHVC